MAIYPSVKPGDPFQPSAALSNDVRRLVNRHYLPSAGSTADQYFGSVRIHVYNSGSDLIRAGTFVIPDTAADFRDEIAPVTSGGSASLKVWYALSKMAPGAVGECIVRDTLIVKAEGKGDYAMPVIDSDRVKLGSSGFPVLFASGGKALIELTGIAEGYRGSFPVTLEDNGTLEVGPGYLSRNGKIELVSGASNIAPRSGVLCVTSKISGDNWTKPVFAYAEVDSTSYPIAVIEVSGFDIFIRQYPVSVAVILETKPCPLIRKD